MSDVATLRRPDEWCRRLDLHVVDPDGWRKADGVGWLDPITEEDFMNRYSESTIKVVHR